MAYGTRFGRSDFEQLAISYKSYALRAILSSYTLLSPTRYASRGTRFGAAGDEGIDHAGYGAAEDRGDPSAKTAGFRW